jgi:hypothetical protein
MPTKPTCTVKYVQVRLVVSHTHGLYGVYSESRMYGEGLASWCP